MWNFAIANPEAFTLCFLFACVAGSSMVRALARIFYKSDVEESVNLELGGKSDPK